MRKGDRIPEIRARASLFDMGLTLRQKGKRWWGCCPFHAENTASFFVDADGRRFHCFGCNAKGDVLDFVMQTRHMSKAEAIDALADQYGITEGVTVVTDRLTVDPWHQRRVAAFREFIMLAAQLRDADAPLKRPDDLNNVPDETWDAIEDAIERVHTAEEALRTFWRQPGFYDLEWWQERIEEHRYELCPAELRAQRLRPTYREWWDLSYYGKWEHNTGQREWLGYLHVSGVKA